MGGEALQRLNTPPRPSRERKENLALVQGEGPDSYGSRVPSTTPRKTSPGLLRELGSDHNARGDFTQTPTGAGLHPRLRQQELMAAKSDRSKSVEDELEDRIEQDRSGTERAASTSQSIWDFLLHGDLGRAAKFTDNTIGCIHTCMHSRFAPTIAGPHVSPHRLPVRHSAF